jgi:hypothetical protein
MVTNGTVVEHIIPDKGAKFYSGLQRTDRHFVSPITIRRPQQKMEGLGKQKNNLQKLNLEVKK